MNPWQAFTASVPWFVRPNQRSLAQPAQPPGTWRARSAEFSRLFPRLEQLLTRARVTQLSVDDQSFVLFSWSIGADTAGWLCAPPIEDPPPGLCSAHAVLLRSFGGIVERCGEPETWLLNHEEVFTVKQAAQDGSMLADYAWAFPDEKVPIAVADFYSVAREANGNTTLCQRNTAEIILFAPDHSFDHVTPWRGLPDYTLYSMNGAPDFPSFVETIAEQWLTVSG